MVKIYVNLITKGFLTMENVPETLKEQVKQSLIESGYIKLAD